MNDNRLRTTIYLSVQKHRNIARERWWPAISQRNRNGPTALLQSLNQPKTLLNCRHCSVSCQCRRDPTRFYRNWPATTRPVASFRLRHRWLRRKDRNHKLRNWEMTNPNPWKLVTLFFKKQLIKQLVFLLITSFNVQLLRNEQMKWKEGKGKRRENDLEWPVFCKFQA